MRFPFWTVLAAAGCSVLATPGMAEEPDELLTSPLAEIWGRAPVFDRPRLSPNGDQLLFLTQDDLGIGQAFVLDLESTELTRIGVGSEDGYDIGWCEWANAERVVCDLVFAVNADGSDFVQIQSGRLRRPPERYANCGIPRQVGAVDVTMDWTPEDPLHIVRACGGAPQQFNLQSGFVETLNVGFGRAQRGQLISDGHNFTRLQRHRETQAGYDRWYFRESLDGEWKLIQDTNPLEFSEPLRPIGFGENLSVLYHLQPAEGVWGLYAYVLDDELVNQQIFTHPLFDIELVDTMGAYDRVVAAAYLDERPQRLVLDERVSEVYLSALELFPGHNIEVVDESWDASKYLVLVRPPQQVGVYYLLDMNSGELEALGAMYDHMADVELAETQSVFFAAHDGGMISGHVTLPPDTSGTVPTVIIPRATPSSLDLEDPHYLVQFLAASGYAVMRVNNRGPEEYDDAWLPNRTAFAWERTAADIDSAMRYLIEQGVAEEGKVCTLGRNVGAYAAFLNAIEYPGVMDCVIGIGSVATPGSGDWATVIAGEATVLQKDSSPIRRSKDWDASVLLFHGQYDGIVDMLSDSSADLAQSLDRKDFDVTFIEYEYARHDIKRAPYRIDMLTRIGNFLDARIGQ